MLTEMIMRICVFPGTITQLSQYPTGHEQLHDR